MLSHLSILPSFNGQIIFHFTDENVKVKESGASLIAQLVKNPSAMQETLVRFLGQKDPLEKG